MSTTSLLSKQDDLESLLRRISDLNEPTKAEFRDIFSESRRVLCLSDMALAGALLVSLPTLERWASGKVAPHPMVRNAVLYVLKTETQKQLEGIYNES